MVTQDVHDALPTADQAHFTPNPPIRVKNVSRPVTTFTHTLPTAIPAAPPDTLHVGSPELS